MAQQKLLQGEFNPAVPTRIVFELFVDLIDPFGIVDAFKNFADQATLFIQSDVPQVSELCWLLMTGTPMGLLERCVGAAWCSKRLFEQCFWAT